MSKNTIPSATDVSIRACAHTGACIIQPMQYGNLLLDCVGVSFFKQSQLEKAIAAIRLYCHFSPALVGDICNNQIFRNLPA